MGGVTVPDTRAAVSAAERTLLLAWVIVAGAVLFSVLTVTPLVERVTPAEWRWTAPILPVVVDAAVVIVVRIDSIIARLGGRPGGWSAALRWLTGGFTLALNIGDSALKGDLVGVGVHMVAPVLLIVTAEASLSYRRAITDAVARIEQAEADAHERSRAAHEAAVQAERDERRREQEAADRTAREQAAREQAERDAQRAAAREEREHAARMQREEQEHAAKLAREEREHAATIAREAADRAAAERERERQRQEAAALAERQEAAARAERERVEQERERARLDRERRDREAGERAARERREAAALAERERREAAEHAARERARREREQIRERLAQTAAGQLPEHDARNLIAAAVGIGGFSQRQMSAATGWSVGWVAARCKELTSEHLDEFSALAGIEGAS